jgi:hypothetical protein
MNCPKWHFGQVGQVRKKDHVGGQGGVIDISNGNMHDFL